MALEKQNISISFDKGIDTKRDPKQIALGKLLMLKNGFFKAINKIQQRYGFDRLAQSSELTAGNMIAPYANELVGVMVLMFIRIHQQKLRWTLKAVK